MSIGDEMGVTSRTPLGRRDQVTLVSGTSFVVCAPGGDIGAEGNEGYFADDTRLVSRLDIGIEGLDRHDLPPSGDDAAVVAFGDPTRPRLLLRRRVALSTAPADGLTISMRIDNLEADPWHGHVDVCVDADFADVFQVKRGDHAGPGTVTRAVLRDGVALTYRHDGFGRAVSVRADAPTEALTDGVRIPVDLGPRAHRSITLRVGPTDERRDPTRRRGDDRSHEGRERAAALSERLRLAPPPPGSDRWHAVWKRACHDLASLVIGDDHSGRAVIAAGSPWFMALFGRDSLLAGMMTLATGPDLLVDTLHALAARQGTRWDQRSAEQPGRILHEVRRGETTARPDGWGSVYYGTVDATPLFVLGVHRAWRMGAAEEDIVALLDSAERAMDWMLGPADVAGLGLVGYVSDAGDERPALRNQCWKDSDDGLRRADGSVLDGCILPVEVQGYAEAALRGLAELRDAFDTRPSAPLVAAADRIAELLEHRFWMPAESCYAVALDGDGRPVGSVTSNPGHLLWSGVVPPHRAPTLAARLMEDDVFSGAGLRTLSTLNPGHNPLSYHCGSVWPHDSALAAAGMLRSGCTELGVELAEAVLGVAVHLDGRLPELVAGLPAPDRAPLAYPSACCPQAWASAAIVLLVSELSRVGA